MCHNCSRQFLHIPVYTNTCLAEEDYPTDPIVFTIPPGIGPFTVEVPITDDDIDEDMEEYFIGVLSFTGDSTGAILGESIILLTIIDDDSKFV